uniref:Uncharacterized protein n=1 Tax=Anopheles farauti TaxID=69004 RepID=A0A182QD98_9DIPT
MADEPAENEGLLLLYDRRTQLVIDHRVFRGRFGVILAADVVLPRAVPEQFIADNRVHAFACQFRRVFGGLRGVWETSFGANVTCVLPPPRSSAATVLRPFSLPSRKFTVNHEKIPSSIPSIISTASSFTRNPDVRNNRRQATSSASAWAGFSSRSPAVAFSTSGVCESLSCGTTVFARSSSFPMLAAPSSGRSANADRPGFDCSNNS